MTRLVFFSIMIPFRNDSFQMLASTHSWSASGEEKGPDEEHLACLMPRYHGEHSVILTSHWNRWHFMYLIFVCQGNFSTNYILNGLQIKRRSRLGGGCWMPGFGSIR